ncbi:hypothetical protein D3C86_2018840 [compost metagenome]
MFADVVAADTSAKSFEFSNWQVVTDPCIRQIRRARIRRTAPFQCDGRFGQLAIIMAVTRHEV